MTREIILSCQRVLDALEQEFEYWKPHLKDISRYISPRKGRFLDEDTIPNNGDKRNLSIIDSIATESNRTLAAGMQGGLTSPARPWFKLTLRDKDLADFRPVKLWLEELRNRMLRIFNKSNFYNVTHSTYYELGAYGTGAMMIEEDFETGIRCYPFTVGEYFIATNFKGIVDTFFRVYDIRVRDAARRFGEENLSEANQAKLKGKSGGMEYMKIVHAIKPNYAFTGLTLESSAKRYLSIYYEYKGHNDKLLSLKGYDEFPVAVPRWDVTGSDEYGRGPGMDALPDVKMLQSMQELAIEAQEKFVNPPINAPADMKGKPISIVPGDINYIEGNNQQEIISPTYQVPPATRDIEFKIERVQDSIRRKFFTDLFLMLGGNQGREMTAFEVAERQEEKLLLLGPVIERVQPELLGKSIDRTYNIMKRNGAVPLPPPDIEGESIEIEYESLLAQAQKLAGIRSMDRAVGAIVNLSQFQPDILDTVDFDEVAQQQVDMGGAPASILRDSTQILNIRQARAEAEAKAANAEALQDTIGGAKTLSETDSEGPNALTELMNAMTP